MGGAVTVGCWMHVIIVGGGISGLSLALSLHQIGVACRIYDQVGKLEPIGHGINLQPNAVRELTALGPVLAPAQNRTCGFPAYGLYGAFFVKGASRHFCPRCYSILLFDPRREHSSIPTAHCRRRRAQRRSRTALL